MKHPGRVTSITYSKYPKQHAFGGKKVLNLGCGTTTYPHPNVINLDAEAVDGVNLVWDLSKTPLPFEDNTFDFIIANHILEHVPNWWECFKELARIVKVGGTVEIWLPGDGNSSQLGYRDHINTINACSFVGVRGTYRNLANAWESLQRKQLGFVCDLNTVSFLHNMMAYWWIAIWPQSVQVWMAVHLRNVVNEQGWKFKKLPPEGEK